MILPLFILHEEIYCIRMCLQLAEFQGHNEEVDGTILPSME